MKTHFDMSSNWKFWRRTLFVAMAALALLNVRAFADVVNASYTTGAEVPVSADEFNANGKSVAVKLNFAPRLDTDLTVVRNTGQGFIHGKFNNLVQGQIVTLHHGGTPYHFVANYYGGEGKDLVLMPTTLDDLSTAAVEKLDNPLLLALKKSRGEAPFDRTTSLRPEDYERAGRVLVDIHGAISNELVSRIAGTGAQVINGWQTPTSLRAWVPLARLEAVANLAGIHSISAAKPSITHRLTH